MRDEQLQGCVGGVKTHVMSCRAQENKTGTPLQKIQREILEMTTKVYGWFCATNSWGTIQKLFIYDGLYCCKITTTD